MIFLLKVVCAYIWTYKLRKFSYQIHLQSKGYLNLRRLKCSFEFNQMNIEICFIPFTWNLSYIFWYNKQSKILCAKWQFLKSVWGRLCAFNILVLSYITELENCYFYNLIFWTFLKYVCRILFVQLDTVILWTSLPIVYLTK